jgi:hypothetical protein
MNEPMQFFMIMSVMSRMMTAVTRMPHLVCSGISGFSFRGSMVAALYFMMAAM